MDITVNPSTRVAALQWLTSQVGESEIVESVNNSIWDRLEVDGTITLSQTSEIADGLESGLYNQSAMHTVKAIISLLENDKVSYLETQFTNIDGEKLDTKSVWNRIADNHSGDGSEEGFEEWASSIAVSWGIGKGAK